MKYSVTLPFSREHECEADTFGMQICAKACYNPEGAHAFFKALSKIETKYGGEVHLGWTSTHPRTKHRDHAAQQSASTKTIINYFDHCIYSTADVKKKIHVSPLASRAHHTSRIGGLWGAKSALKSSKTEEHRVSVRVLNKNEKEDVDVYWIDYGGDPHLWTSLSANQEASCLPMNGAVFVLVEPHTHDLRGTFTAHTSGVRWLSASANNKSQVHVDSQLLKFQTGDSVLYLTDQNDALDATASKTKRPSRVEPAKVLGEAGEGKYKIQVMSSGSIETVSSGYMRIPQVGARVTPNSSAALAQGAKIYYLDEEQQSALTGRVVSCDTSTCQVRLNINGQVKDAPFGFLCHHDDRPVF